MKIFFDSDKGKPLLNINIAIWVIPLLLIVGLCFFVFALIFSTMISGWNHNTSPSIHDAVEKYIHGIQGYEDANITINTVSFSFYSNGSPNMGWNTARFYNVTATINGNNHPSQFIVEKINRSTWLAEGYCVYNCTKM